MTLLFPLERRHFCLGADCLPGCPSIIPCFLCQCAAAGEVRALTLWGESKELPFPYYALRYILLTKGYSVFLR